ncbi:phosphate transport system permease protein PstA [Zafaria cholistanensis]|uniref:Phosphate transport system permease protein PstA n=1 Tax=Zafaria cholistanensis TaxID=1682741 RepID=A0A5A7NT71_9MICC|nr:phosphate ABC transporter permease PstA [Zafaria cholistanensis]GER24084.1 phosphate transport system permease protein PstA [Zafaria cholistanensis]
MTVTTEIRSSRSALTRNKLPNWAPWAVAAGALVVSAAVLSLAGFNVWGWAVLAAVLFVAANWAVSFAVEGARKATDRFATSLMFGAFIVAMVPLVSVIWTVLTNGIAGFSLDFLTSDMQGVRGRVDNATAAGESPLMGGIAHALTGTFLITLWASIISIPIGLLTAIYLVEYGQGGRLARAITFFVDVMTGIPSIVAGLFAAGLFALIAGPGFKAGIVGAVALSVLMIPVVVRSSEEMLKIVPNELREASYALGVRKWRTIVKVVIPTAISGIASGVTIAIARVIGETAPLIVTAGFVTRMNTNVFSDWMASLPAFIYYQILNPTSPTNPEPSTLRAWAAALVLIILVMLLNLGARLIARIFAPKIGR